MHKPLLTARTSDPEVTDYMSRVSIAHHLEILGSTTCAAIGAGQPIIQTSAYHINMFLIYCELHGIETLGEMRATLQIACEEASDA